jgi:hypothetical protein
MAAGKSYSALRAAAIGLFAAAAATSASTCPAASREIPVGMIAGVDSSDARQIADYPGAIDAIVRVLMQKYKLPVPHYTMEISSTPEAFQIGLMTHLGMNTTLARSTARFGKAAVGNHRVLVNELAVANLGWPERIELLAHELTHTAQLELAGGRRSLTRQHWLTEGFAEWMAYAVTDSLGLDDAARVRARITADLRRAGGRAGLPHLAQLNTIAQWIAARNKYGYGATYSLSFLVVEFLIQRHSFAAVLDYFRRFEGSMSYAGNFRLAFGESISDFEVELERHLAQLLG